MNLAIVIPTVAGREEHLERCLAAYRKTSPGAKVYIEHDHSTCGAGWIAGAERATADDFEYLHFSADDLEPLDGWLDVAVETVCSGFIPAPLVFHPNGKLQSAGLERLSTSDDRIGYDCHIGPYWDWMFVEGTTVPFLTRAMWEKIGMIPIHWLSDLYVSRKGREAGGWDTVVRTDMRFTHHGAQAGRLDSLRPEDLVQFMRAFGQEPRVATIESGTPMYATGFRR